jgi:hypothetical protein
MNVDLFSSKGGGRDSSCVIGKVSFMVSAQGQKPSRSPRHTDSTKAGLGWSFNKDSKTSILIGVRTWKRCGLLAIVLEVIGFEVSVRGGRGRGRARSDHSAVVGERHDPSSHRLCRKYFGWSPKISSGPFRTVFASVSSSVALFADMSIFAFAVGILTCACVEFVARFRFTGTLMRFSWLLVI